ncbi:MAG: DUF2333 family protein [Deltaproteobacteria bacterium]|nr:DUF2333 family protein [Deltaproteobacteria bacterium]MBW2016275.1 DUF2333 family protein [Deltaproteobacteria bacterium]MBW2303319.1 DUF2333 family protein [Deltaproteobacteria bacterium]
MKEKSRKKMSTRDTKKGHMGSVLLVLVVVLGIFILAVMALNSRKPGPLVLEDVDANVKGAHFIRTNQALVKQMLENWMPNDLFWPTVFLDNMPNFQIGELEVVRYNVRVLRDNLSRMRTTDKLDPFAEAAFTALSNDPYKWWFPSAESKWKLGYDQLESFYRNLLTGKSDFYPRADNLVELLTQYASLMGGVNTRLINAPGDISQTLMIEEKAGETAPSQGGSTVVDINIPWYRVDDNFYYAQGVAYALNESFKAIRSDFKEVLVDKNSLLLVDKILEVLGRCQFEPLIVFNGDPDSIFANHSLNLSGLFNDARQKIQSLVVALKEG